MTRRGWLLFAALGLIWGIPYLLIRVSVREVSPGFLVFVRTAGGALLLAPLVLRENRSRAGGPGGPAWRSLARHWKPLVVYTAVEIGAPWWLLFDAEKKVTSSLAGLLVAAVPIAGALIARVAGTDHLDRRRLAGLGLGIVGVASLVGFDVGGSDWLAASSFLVVVAGYALGPWILGRHLSDLPGVSVVAASLALCALAYTPFAVLQWPARPVSAGAVWSMAGLTVLCTAVAFTTMFALVGEVGAMRATVVTYLNPAVAVVLGVSVLGEHFGPASAVGFLLVLAGSFLATRPLRSGAPPLSTVEGRLVGAEAVEVPGGRGSVCLDGAVGEAGPVGAGGTVSHLD